MEESTLRCPTDMERKEMEEVHSIGEVPHTEKLMWNYSQIFIRVGLVIVLLSRAKRLSHVPVFFLHLRLGL